MKNNMLKKLTVAALALLIACLPLASMAEEADTDALTRKFEAVWYDDGVFLEIWREGDGYLCGAVSGEGDGETFVWIYSDSHYVPETDALVFDGGERRYDVFDEETGETSSEVVAENLTATFTVTDNDLLIWEDSEGMCKDYSLQREYFDEDDSYWNAADLFEGSWVCGDYTLRIGREDDAYKCMIARNTEDDKTTEWMYTCLYDSESETMVSVGFCTKSIVTYDENDDIVATEELYNDGEATFSFDEEGRVIWNDAKEDAGSGLAFEYLVTPGVPPMPDEIADGYLRVIAGIPQGTAGASLAQAQAACDACMFAVNYGLWNTDVDALRENLFVAWEDLTDDERAAFDASFMDIVTLLDGCMEDWDANRAVFEDAGVAEQMDMVMYDPLNRLAWETLRNHTLTMGNSED